MVLDIAGGGCFSQCSHNRYSLYFTHYSCHAHCACVLPLWSTKEQHWHLLCTVCLIDNYVLIVIVQRNARTDCCSVHCHTRYSVAVFLYLSMLPNIFLTVMVVVRGLLKKYYLFIVRELVELYYRPLLGLDNF